MNANLRQFISRHYNDLLSFSRKVGRGAEYSDDIVGDVVMGVGLMPPSKIDAIIEHGKLLKYLQSAIYIQHRTSNCGKRYKAGEVIKSIEIIDAGFSESDPQHLLTEVEDWFEREIVRLKIEGYTTAEISEMTGITIVNIDRAYIRAKKKLKEKVRC